MIRLPLPLKDHLRDPVHEGVLRRIAQGIDARSPACRRRWAMPLAMAAAAATAAGALLFFHRAPGPLLLADGSALIAVAAGPVAKDLALSDGSRIRLAPGARLEPLASSGVAFSAMVARGRADFEVRPGGSRRWTVECGMATVEVLGTAFACERGPGRLRVVVSRGVVLVRGERVPDRARRLLAGQTLEIVEDAPRSPPRIVGQLAATAPEEEAAALSEDHAQAATVTRPSGHAEAPPRSGNPWRELARRGRHGEAFAMLGTDGLRQESKRLGVNDLLALADVARLSGHPAEAVAPLTRILADFAGDAQAPLAAFALGRLELDSLGRPQAAAEAFARALALGIPRGLREDARARLVEAWARAGNAAAARRAAKAYADEFPRGRHARAVEGWLRPR
ncbi:MAG: FecR domain-containing protein [Deltaproteobacteria bacterium]|nr:FecR domain-containing protein [Deltaproteobacteria bacterium]